MNKLISLVVLVGALINSAMSLGFGKCPTVQTVANFDPIKYSGVWYEIQRGPRITTLFEEGLKCVKAEYTVLPDGKIKVVNSGIKTDGKSSDKTGVAFAPNPTEPSKLIVSFPVIGGLVQTSGNYWVVDTDYESYSLVYSCKDYLNFFKVESLWVLSRGRTLNEARFASLLLKVQSFAKDLIPRMVVQDQKSC